MLCGKQLWHGVSQLKTQIDISDEKEISSREMIILFYVNSEGNRVETWLEAVHLFLNYFC
jgi:hypothetical protein